MEMAVPDRFVKYMNYIPSKGDLGMVFTHK
uniref:Uncharacterized protein n=1 Tax=Anguilla anguilla TaxID=7936 RepID=A0A0E9T041_ANGAN